MLLEGQSGRLGVGQPRADSLIERQMRSAVALDRLAGSIVIERDPRPVRFDPRPNGPARLEAAAPVHRLAGAGRVVALDAVHRQIEAS